jgi:hypothetical protein
LAIRYRCIEDDGDGGGEDARSIAMAATFSLSLSSSDDPLDESMSVSQSPTM